jgi:hypothetical protein
LFDLILSCIKRQTSNKHLKLLFISIEESGHRRFTISLLKHLRFLLKRLLSLAKVVLNELFLRWRLLSGALKPALIEVSAAAIAAAEAASIAAIVISSSSAVEGEICVFLQFWKFERHFDRYSFIFYFPV